MVGKKRLPGKKLAFNKKVGNYMVFNKKYPFKGEYNHGKSM
jgi:hypothetical protein